MDVCADSTSCKQHSTKRCSWCDEAPCPDSVPQSSRKATECLKSCLVRNLYRQCAKSLDGNWSDPNNVQIEELRIIVRNVACLSCALTNYLFLGFLKDSVPVSTNEPRKVLIRVYGEVFRNSVDSIVTDAVNFAILGAKGIGPGLYGLFPGGRIEEFIESRPLASSELPLVIHTVAQHMARIHSLCMPVCKQPVHILNLTEKFLSQLIGSGAPPRRPIPNVSANSLFELENAYSSEGSPSLNGTDKTEFQSVQHLACQLKIHEEHQWLKNQFMADPGFDSPVVFCHNDFQENNILVLNNPEQDGFHEIMPIDFEYASYNYRGFDIGNHFNEWCYDYTNPEPPFFFYDFDRYPSYEQQSAFWAAYLPVYHAEKEQSTTAGYNLNFDQGDSPVRNGAALDETELNRLWIEATYGALYSHILWASWSLIQSQVSSIRFHFKEYAAARMDAYHRLKTVLMSKLADCSPKSSD